MSAPNETNAPAAAPADRGELPKAYRPSDHEPGILARWLESRAFHADPRRVLRGEARPYAIVIPPPNVTDRLHLGHALNNTLQDVLARAHRMMGFETLWMPGTDHAGIATQTVVDRRLRAAGKPAIAELKSTPGGREQFIAITQSFKDEYEATITGQLKAIGCSCDWDRQRFTMDAQCARAVHEAFFRLFRDGLIYRGKRLVNWDPLTQTALADDEVEMREVDGFFYDLRYPLVHSASGEDDPQPVTWSELTRRGYPGAGSHPPEQEAWVTVATTRPETYLGDTAVAVNPRDPRAKPLRGLFVELPLVGRVIPIVEDDYVVMPAKPRAEGDPAETPAEPEDPKAKYATGFLKVTPAHDPNDYEIGRRHGLPVINVMAPDATISDTHGWADVGDAHVFVGKPREQARELVVTEFAARGLLEKKTPYRHSVGHSYRSYAAIEPYLSDQWYVKVTDDRLKGAALRALAKEQASSRSEPKCGTGSERGTGSECGTGFQPVRSSSGSECGAGFQPVRSAPPNEQGARALSRPIRRELHIHNRNLPHWQIGGKTYFVTFRLERGSLSPAERDIVYDACVHWDGMRMELHAAVVMPDHVHLVLSPFQESPGVWHGLPALIRSIKTYSASQVNTTRGVSGTLWQAEYFDRIIREGEYGDVMRYVLENPAAAGLVGSWWEYQWTWAPDETLAGKCRFVDRWVATRVEPVKREERAGTHGLEARATQEKHSAHGLEARASQEKHSAHGLEARVTQDGDLRFFPARYARTYEQWHENIRDWCISRQLWWGHRIPVWRAERAYHGSTSGGSQADVRTAIDSEDSETVRKLQELLDTYVSESGCPTGSAFVKRFGDWHGNEKWIAVCARSQQAIDAITLLSRFLMVVPIDVDDPSNVLNSTSNSEFTQVPGPFETMPRWQAASEVRELISSLKQDPDVLDTWFSSALWPLSTMGWPEETDLLRAFNPTDALSTAREIITLWVSRMVMFNRLFRDGDIPFRDVFIHAVIQDGHGQKMSKSLGNGIDPLDIIATHGADAMRFTLCHMTTQTQDVRMPLDVVCPHTGEVFSPKFTSNPAGFVVPAPVQASPKDPSKSMVTGYGVASGQAKPSPERPLAKNTSTKFDAGRNFCNKLWNAARFAIGTLEKPTESVKSDEPELADRWMLSRLARAIPAIESALASYQFNEYAEHLYDLLWRDFCDWYLEAIKPTIAGNPAQRRVLRGVLDAILRLLHPVLPFITEAIHARLRAVPEAPPPGLVLGPPRLEGLLCATPWPAIDAALIDERAERDFEAARTLVTAIRELRARHNVAPKRRVTLHAPPAIAERAARAGAIVESMAGLGSIKGGIPAGVAPAFVIDGHECRLADLADAVDAGTDRARLEREKAALEKTIATLEGRLANPGYSEKAPPAMVQQTRDQLAKARGDLDVVASRLAAIA